MFEPQKELKQADYKVTVFIFETKKEGKEAKYKVINFICLNNKKNLERQSTKKNIFIKGIQRSKLQGNQFHILEQKMNKKESNYKVTIFIYA